MCPRGEVGAGIIVISIESGISGPAIELAVVCLAINLILSGAFVTWTRQLAHASEARIQAAKAAKLLAKAERRARRARKKAKAKKKAQKQSVDKIEDLKMIDYTDFEDPHSPSHIKLEHPFDDDAPMNYASSAL
jgi:hypothetical protein